MWCYRDFLKGYLWRVLTVWKGIYQFLVNRRNQLEKYMCSKWKVLVAQLYPTFCDPMDWSLPRLSVTGILRASIVGGWPFPFSRGSLRPRDLSLPVQKAKFFTIWATGKTIIITMFTKKQKIYLYKERRGWRPKWSRTFFPIGGWLGIVYFPLNIFIYFQNI